MNDMQPKGFFVFWAVLSLLVLLEGDSVAYASTVGPVQPGFWEQHVQQLQTTLRSWSAEPLNWTTLSVWFFVYAGALAAIYHILLLIQIFLHLLFGRITDTLEDPEVKIKALNLSDDWDANMDLISGYSALLLSLSSLFLWEWLQIVASALTF